MNNLYGMNLEEIKEIVMKYKQPSFRAGQIFKWLYTPVFSIEEMSNLSKEFRADLSKDYKLEHLCHIKTFTEKKTSTYKFLFNTHDDIIIESVLLKYDTGNSVCISTQAGCKMGCVFCKSGEDGFIRDLTAGEMLSQIQMISKLEDVKVSNVVLMGCGEPLDNYDNVLKFIKIAVDKDGLFLSKRSITLSTCGIVDKIYDLANEGVDINLSVSLHSPSSRDRASIMPIEKTNPVFEVIKACKYYREKTKRRITFEYCLIENKNDRQEDIEGISQILKNTDSLINIIGVNDNKTKYNQDYIIKFTEKLKNLGINVTIRRKLGSSINAACGQLKSSYNHKGDK